MRVQVSYTRTAISVGVVMALGLGLWGCGAKTPTGPTAAGHVSVQGATASAAATAAWGTTSVSWNCFAASTAGVFGSPGDCPSPQWTQPDVQGGAVITAAPTNLQATVSGTTVNLQWTAPPAPNQPTSVRHRSGNGIRVEQHHHLQHRQHGDDADCERCTQRQLLRSCARARRGRQRPRLERSHHRGRGRTGARADTLFDLRRAKGPEGVGCRFSGGAHLGIAGGMRSALLQNRRRVGARRE